MSVSFQPATADPQDVLADIGRSWWWTFLFGLLGLAAGILVLSWPHETLRVVAIVIGLQFLVAGVARFVTAFTRDAASGAGRALYFVLALFSVVAGVLVLRHQLQTVAVLALIAGLYWLVTGILLICLAVSEPELPHRWLVLFLGAVAAIAGLVVLVYPVQTAVALARLLGLWLVVISLLDIVLAIALRLSRYRSAVAA